MNNGDPTMKNYFSLFRIFFVAMVLAVVIIGYTAITTYGRLMDECLADGNKEYQCVSMLNGRD